MLKNKIPAGGVLVNVLIAVLVSLVVNFSYFIFMIMHSTTQVRPHVGPEGDGLFVVMEVVYYAVSAFILLTVFTYNMSDSDTYVFWKRLLIAVVISVALYFVAPYMTRYGDVKMLFLGKRVLNPMILLKCSFTLVVVTLYGKIYELIRQGHKISVENEKLKTENLRSKYDVLMSQMNPHFFFNSLNSLAMLVRENKNETALVYIDRLSDTFRYIIRSGHSSMVTLRDEIDFLDAYSYLLELRYAGKLSIETDIPAEYMGMKLPSLTLQPLVENAVKHNAITRVHPLVVKIYVENDCLWVSNVLQPKLDDMEKGTGIGLKNIASRYRLLTDKDIEVINDGRTFTVRLPLAAA